MPFSPLPVGQFRFSLTVTEEIVLPPYKGFAFRGVFGTVLRELACVIPGEDCPRCPFRHTCTYAYLFETSPADGVDGFRRFSNFPRPYIINPPMGDKRQFRRYDTLQFEFVLIGRATECIPHVITTFDVIGQRGIRNGRGRYLIKNVTAAGDLGQQQVVFRCGKLDVSLVPQHSIPLLPDHDGPTSITLDFETPLLLEERGKIQYEPPRFSLLFEHLARRIMLLQALHGAEGVRLEQLGALLNQADDIVITDSDMRWQSMERISNRQRARIKTGGLTGKVIYQGNLAPFMPFFKAGELVHVGKSTTFGFGRYTLQDS